jgi:hypothetical protein
MLMRFCLLVLAMMTGLSAAQAEERLRPVRGGASVQAARTIIAADVQVSETAVALKFSADFVQPVRQGKPVLLVPISLSPASGAIYLTDRARE